MIERMAKRCSYQQFKYLKTNKRLHSTQIESNLKNESLKLLSKKSSTAVDIIGPPDELSNLRPMIFAKSDNETNLEKKYRLTREETQNWNHKFWSEHNTKFIKERKEFQQELMAQGIKSVTADDMSVFYKRFLDKNWKNHLLYNISWYKQNIRILFLEFKVKLSKLKFK